jgi:integrase
LTYGEEARVKQFSPPWLSILITVLAETGLRVRKEALPLKWCEVDLESDPGCIRVRDSKTAAGVRPVWLTKHCRSTLIQWSEFLGPSFSEYVFPSPRKPSTHIADYKKAWQKAAREAGIPDRRIYDLRASFASRANACHASGLTIAQLLGHANSTQILPTYVKPLDENTKAVIEALDAARTAQSTGSRSIQ